MRCVIRPYLESISYREYLSLTLEFYRKRRERMKRILHNREFKPPSLINYFENLIPELDKKKEFKIKFTIVTRKASFKKK